MHSINPRRRPCRDTDEADVWAAFKRPVPSALWFILPPAAFQRDPHTPSFL